ncbi:MAG: proline--tRNA ligase [Clostridia bacterium]|nr:proline--tRNA ligase [Clostridia bacterium]
MGKNNNDNFVKEITNIEEDFAQWYTDIVLKAELCDYTDTKGCIAFKPYGYAIWENIQKYVDEKFKATGVQNVYFPVLIPESLLEKEKDHVEGFAPEVAWITEAGGKKLEEKFCIRPTSETIISTMYSKWLSSWRDLPMVYNQWCNVLRWEKETRPFLRTREFLWQEGHTIHETAKEAQERTLQMLDVYTDTVENLLAIPVVRGIKTEKEKFAGAEETYTIETMMHDGKALQTATSHYFGQNFTKPFDIKFQNREGKEEYAYQTSWGITTRLIGAIIMAHGDNRGLRMPPKVAPTQVVIVPIAQHKEGVLDKANELFCNLKKDFRVKLDDRDNYSPGFKFNDWEMRGIPVRVEIGPRDIENGVCVVSRRDTGDKETVELDKLNEKISELLEKIHENMFNECKERLKDRTTIAHTLEEFEKQINEKQGFIKTMWCEDVACEDKIKELTAAKSRCMPFEQECLDDKCVVCGRPAKKMVIWGRQY